MLSKDGNRSTQILKWLHFSDAHMGMREQRRQWARPALKLKEDIKFLLDKTGGADTLIFSGDLTQSASRDQFEAFNEEIVRIQDWIEQNCGARPKLIAAPGNHDLQRPSTIAPESVALRQFWTSNELRDAIWVDAGKRYRDFLENCFSEYSEWLRTAIDSGIHAKPDQTGIFPGDAAYTVHTKAGRTGIVTLNSTWLQLGGGDYRGKLHVDSLQVMNILGDRPDDHLSHNDANMLVTHHPVDWLHSSSQEGWDRDINPTGRFDLHLFGHMHEHKAVSTRYGGSPGKQAVQACSMFGLEWEGDTLRRSQGYSAGAVSVLPDRFFESWPRKLVTVAGGDVKFVPDTAQNLDEKSSSFKVGLESAYEKSLSSNAKIASTNFAPNEKPANLSPDPTFELTKIRRSAFAERAHLHVRRIEQNAVLASLKTRKIAWLSSEWGLDEEAFAACLESKLIGSGGMYSIDLSEFTSRAKFFDRVQQTLGTSFQAIAGAVANAGPSLVIFSGIDLDRADDDFRSRQLDLEDIAQAFSDFAPEAYFLLICRNLPRSSVYDRTELRPLDEADLAVYLKEVDANLGEPITPAFVSRIMRHTDGVPGRIDLALRELEVGSIDSLPPSNPDLVPSATSLVVAPEALVATITELRSSELKQERRSFKLLLALSGLPQGEQISRLKRFFDADIITNAHAIELLDRSLIKTRTVASENASSSSTDKILLVPKIVRDYVRDSISESESRSLDRRSLKLYFGDSWAIGDISTSLASKQIGEALCDGYEIQNMSALVFRAVSRAIEAQESFDLSGAIRLSLSFIKLLFKGSHYRAATSACEDMLSLLADVESNVSDINLLRNEYAESLRMCGRTEDAIKSFETVDLSLLRKTDRAHTELHMALCYERLNKIDEARAAANSLIKSSPKLAAANQARAIIAGLIEDGEERAAELMKVLASARKKNQHTIANNIIMELATEAEDVQEARELLRGAIKNAAELKFYSVARLIVQLASLPGATDWMLPQERSLLIEAYYYLYNERLLPLFENCHSSLWDVFERDGDYPNLLNLFRHSSFIWRLSGKDSSEIKYLTKLASAAWSAVIPNDTFADRNRAYLVVRIAVVLGEAGKVASDDEDDDRS